MRRRVDSRLIRRILVPTDGSEGALEAAKYAAGLASHFGASVTILHVIDPLPALRHFSDAERGRLRQQLLDQGNAFLALTQTPLAQAGIAVDRQLREGHPGDLIPKVAAEEDVDLIVIGSRGTGMANSLLLGSVSQQVALNAPCPVLVVRSRRSAGPVQVCDAGDV